MQQIKQDFEDKKKRSATTEKYTGETPRKIILYSPGGDDVQDVLNTEYNNIQQITEAKRKQLYETVDNGYLD